MKLLDRLRSKSCEFCETPLIDQKVYIARGEQACGLVNEFNGTECILYDAVDCPRCGRQYVIGKRLREVTRIVAQEVDYERSIEEAGEVQEEVHENS